VCSLRAGVCIAENESADVPFDVMAIHRCELIFLCGIDRASRTPHPRTGVSQRQQHGGQDDPVNNC